MFIDIPDQFPGRCINVRGKQRCLYYENRTHVCQFPEPPTMHKYEEFQVYRPRTPEPWVSPLDDKKG